MYRSLVALLLSAFVTANVHAADAPLEPIAIIGTGSVGGTLGVRWASLGHPIIYGSRDPQRVEVRELVAKSPGKAIAVTPAEAVRRAQLVLFAVPWEAAQQSSASLGDLTGKIVIDVTNPLVFEGNDDREVAVPHSGAELIQGWMRGARLVKAFNTLNWKTMRDPARAGGAVTIPIAGDDEEAKRRVAALATALGFETFDVGPLSNSRYLEAMALLYVNRMIQNPPQLFEYHLRPLPAAR